MTFVVTFKLLLAVCSGKDKPSKLTLRFVNDVQVVLPVGGVHALLAILGAASTVLL